MYEASWRDVARDAQTYLPGYPLWDLPGPRTQDGAYVLEPRTIHQELRFGFDRGRGCWLASFDDPSGCLYVAEGRGIDEARRHLVEVMVAQSYASPAIRKKSV
jgi:hypothetical protein